MKLSANNLIRADQIAEQLLDEKKQQHNQSSVSYFGSGSGSAVDISFALWANDPQHRAGAITPDLGNELLKFLQQAEQAKADKVILLLDSAGVSLEHGWPSMMLCAEIIKKLLNLSITGNSTTLALLGEKVGCFGGALLIAGACQYQLGSRTGNLGVSGRKVIARVSGSEPEFSRLIYRSSYRLLNQELTTLIPEEINVCSDLLVKLPNRPLTLNSLQQSLQQLRLSSKEDLLAIGQVTRFSTEGMGCDQLLAFIEQLNQYLETDKVPPVFNGDCVQAFSFLNEQRGFSRYLSLAMKYLRYIAYHHGEVTYHVDKKGMGATFIALTMMADKVNYGANAHIYPLPEEVVNDFSGTTQFTGQEWKQKSYLQ